jgi:hypothetical protein
VVSLSIKYSIHRARSTLSYGNFPRTLIITVVVVVFILRTLFASCRGSDSDASDIIARLLTDKGNRREGVAKA